VRLLPFIVIVVFFIMMTGAILPVWGRYQPFYIIGGAFIVVGSALMHIVSGTTAIGAIYTFEVLTAIGVGVSFQNGYSIAAAKVKPAEVPAAIGFINVAQIGTLAITLSIAGSIYQNEGFAALKDALAEYHFSEMELRAALGGAQSEILQIGGDPKARSLALAAIVDTISKIWIMPIVAGAVTLVSGIFMRREKLQLEMTAGG
jgi:hypothetical protein